MLTTTTNNPKTIINQLKTTPLLEIENHSICNATELVSFARTLGDLLAWEFGLVNELHYDPQARNYLYSDESVPFHWDGAFAQSPHLLIFHCVKAPPKGSGGETLFTDCQSLLNSLTKQQYQHLSSLTLIYETEKKAHYGGTATTPCIMKHPVTQKPTLRYAEPVVTEKNPVALSIPKLTKEEQYDFEELMKEKLYDPAFCYSHEWQDNQLIIADNHALLHGRNAFTQPYSRHIRRVQVLELRHHL